MPHPPILTLALAVADPAAVLAPLAGAHALARWHAAAAAHGRAVKVVVVAAPGAAVDGVAAWVAGHEGVGLVTVPDASLEAASFAAVNASTTDTLTVDAACLPGTWLDPWPLAASARILGGVVEFVGGAAPAAAYAPHTAGVVGRWVAAGGDASTPPARVTLPLPIPSLTTPLARLLAATVLARKGFDGIPADDIGSAELVAELAAAVDAGVTLATAARLPPPPAPVRTPLASPYVTSSSVYGASGFTPPPPPAGRTRELGAVPPPRGGRGEGGMRFGVGGKGVRLHGAL